MKKQLAGVALVLVAVSLGSIQPVEACTRAVYIGPDQMVITGRTMDWKEDIMTNIYVFPRGIQRAGHNKDKTVNWTAKYGSVIATGYDIGTCDGMNEKGLVASLLFLPESIYSLPGDTRPAMGISIWTQYVLDNFATVREAVDELKKETFRIDAPRIRKHKTEIYEIDFAIRIDLVYRIYFHLYSISTVIWNGRYKRSGTTCSDICKAGI